MNLKTRIKKIETATNRNFNDWLHSLSDEELEKIAGSQDRDVDFREWLKTLTDDELETLCYDRPGARILREKFNEYQKQNQKN